MMLTCTTRMIITMFMMIEGEVVKVVVVLLGSIRLTRCNHQSHPTPKTMDRRMWGN